MRWCTVGHRRPLFDWIKQSAILTMYKTTARFNIESANKSTFTNNKLIKFLQGTIERHDHFPTFQEQGSGIVLCAISWATIIGPVNHICLNSSGWRHLLIINFAQVSKIAFQSIQWQNAYSERFVYGKYLPKIYIFVTYSLPFPDVFSLFRSFKSYYSSILHFVIVLAPIILISIFVILSIAESFPNVSVPSPYCTYTNTNAYKHIRTPTKQGCQRLYFGFEMFRWTEFLNIAPEIVDVWSVKFTVIFHILFYSVQFTRNIEKL